MTLRKFLIGLLLLLCVSPSLRLETNAQIRPIYDQGALGLTQLLKRLNTNASALMIGAHPDDEDTALLAYLARGESARTAYLSLTRGDGGQNIIGPELGEALGVIRTEELLQARKLDGAGQFFTRAYDYGFSKTLAEAKSKWDESVILCDVVRVIRLMQPLVVISQFSGTPQDGHGQHQFAGYISPLAVKAAADPAQCKETGTPWVVKKFYTRHRGPGEPTLRINTGKYDPVLGRSYFEIAMHARSQHRSQEQGVLELKGDQFSNLNLVFPPAGPEKETSVFDGLNASQGITAPLVGDYDPLHPQSLIPRLHELRSGSRDSGVVSVATEALLRAAGIRIDALAARETAVAGETLPVAVRIFSNSADTRVTNVSFNLPFVKTPAPSQGNFRREAATFEEHFAITIPPDQPLTQPYWLLGGRRGDLFSIGERMEPSLPLQVPETAFANILLEIAGQQVQLRQPVEYRFADDIRGEIRRDLNVVPKITVALDRELLIVSAQSKERPTEVSVNLTNNTTGPITGRVTLGLPNGWRAQPSEANFSMTRNGERTSVSLTITIPRSASPGSYQIKAEATANGETFTQTMQTIAYDHIQTHRIYRPAVADVKLIDLKVTPIKVGYITGSGDKVDDAIKQFGLEVEEIDERVLAAGDLSRFDTIVVGIRAYQVRPDVVANNKRLLDFANNGGTLIVQYQLPPTYSQPNLTPYPTQMGPRTSDENAAVTILEPAHPVFNFPNKITAEDFTGWVQERNLYNFSNMDPKYIGLLESHDAGEAENKGGLVVADLGKGKYVYCSYSLFRQLPAGVPGAYRLLANLLSLPKAKASVVVK